MSVYRDSCNSWRLLLTSAIFHVDLQRECSHSIYASAAITQSYKKLCAVFETRYLDFCILTALIAMRRLSLSVLLSDDAWDNRFHLFTLCTSAHNGRQWEIYTLFSASRSSPLIEKSIPICTKIIIIFFIRSLYYNTTRYVRCLCKCKNYRDNNKKVKNVEKINGKHEAELLRSIIFDTR